MTFFCFFFFFFLHDARTNTNYLKLITKQQGSVPACVLTLLEQQPTMPLPSEMRSARLKASSKKETKKAAPILQIVKLRNNDWDLTVPRAEGLLLKGRTDLGLVDLPGTPFMTSREGARKLLHQVVTTGDVGSDELGLVQDQGSGLMRRTLRPPTAQSPRVVVQTTNKYKRGGSGPGGDGGDRVLDGFATLSLLPAPLSCELCKSQRRRVCMCVVICAHCNKFSYKNRAGHRGESFCSWCGLGEGDAVRLRSAVTSMRVAAKATDAAFRGTRLQRKERLARSGSDRLGAVAPHALDLLHPPPARDRSIAPLAHAESWRVASPSKSIVGATITSGGGGSGGGSRTSTGNSSRVASGLLDPPWQDDDYSLASCGFPF